MNNQTIRSLVCCCCGESTRGKQWWNRDNGFGLCNNCVVRIKDRKDYDEEDFKLCYGILGVHYCVQDE